LIDSHCHLDDPALLCDLVQRRAAGATGWVCAGFEPERWAVQKTFRAADIWHAVGQHPWSKAPWDAHQLERELDQGWARAVGECGLDFAAARTPTERSAQERILADHLRIARERSLPVVLHLVRSHEASLRLVDSAGELRGMVHSFNGSVDQARAWLDRGFHLSLNSRARWSEALARSVPPERVLIESDAPGRGNTLESLEEALAHLCLMTGQSRNHWVETTRANALRLFA
jgi:TatD DNase family protein